MKKLRGVESRCLHLVLNRHILVHCGAFSFKDLNPLNDKYHLLLSFQICYFLFLMKEKTDFKVKLCIIEIKQLVKMKKLVEMKI